MTSTGCADSPKRWWKPAPAGSPLHERAVAVVKFVTAHCDLPVIGVGGIDSPAAARRMFDAGASLVQLYTGLVYRGPGLVRAIAREAS